MKEAIKMPHLGTCIWIDWKRHCLVWASASSLFPFRYYEEAGNSKWKQ